jgi:hypothetical protein
MAPCWAPVPFHGFDQARKDGVAVDFPSPERLSNKKSDEPRLTEFEEIRKSMKYIVLGYFPETFETSCSEVWDTARDTSSCGYEQNDQAERAATAKGYRTMRAGTRERISIIAGAGVTGDYVFQLA